MPINYDSVMQGFVSESAELLDRAESSALEMEKGFNENLVNEIFRAMHTIKGNSGLFDLENISSLAHSLENLLNSIRIKEITSEIPVIDLILTSIDRLRTMINHVDESKGKDNSDIITKITALLKSREKNSEIRTEVTPALSQDHIPGIVEVKKEVSSLPAKEPKPELESKSVSLKSDMLEEKQESNGKTPSFRIPGKYIRMAHDTGNYLTLVYIDLKSQEEPNLSSLAQRISSIKPENLLMHGPRKEHVENFCATFPYFLLLLTDIPGNRFIAQFKLKGKTRMLYNPDGHDQQIPGKAALLDLSKNNGSNIQEVPPQAEVVSRKSNSSPDDTAASRTAKEANSSGDAAAMEKDSSRQGLDKADTHLRVPVSLIDSLINLAGETVIARNEMSQKISRIHDIGLDMIGKRMSQLITRMQEGIMRTRLQELNIVFQRLPRLVRDVSRVTGKNVDLVLSGGEVELDKSMIEAIGDSMMHMIRNAIDHGIETSDERKRLGKKEKGLINVSAHLRGGNVVLVVRDDGSGLDLEKIKEKAIFHNLISREESVHIPEEQVIDLIFHPGLSTADRVTSTSGRGVGMDVVRSSIKMHGGNVEATSERGKGTTFIATIPQTLSIVTCLLVRSGGALFALPQQNLVELILLDPEKVQTVEEHRVYELRGHLLPLVELGKMLKLSGARTGEGEHIAVVHSERHYFGIVVDEVVNLEEIVIKRLGEHFLDLTFFAGAAIMGDGEAILVLDVPGIARFVNLQANTLDEQESVAEEKGLDEGYLLFESAGQKLAVPVATIPRIEKIGDNIVEDFMGREVVKYREEVVPIIRLESVYDLPDAKKAVGSYYLIIFNIDGVRSGIVADEIHNVVRELPNLDKNKFIGDSVIGHSILNGEITLIIDAVDLIKMLMKNRFREINKIKITQAEAVLNEASV